MRAWLEKPAHLRAIHFWLMIFWTAPSILLSYLIVYHMNEPHAQFAILIVSVYANFVGHWAAWQSVRAEEASGTAPPS
jgi:hypothetical protein